MTTHMKLIAMSVTLVLTSRIVFAADGAQHPCSQVRDDHDRLACYDQAFGKPPESSASMAPAPKEQFGFTEATAARNSGQATDSAGAASITASITALDRRSDGKFLVSLDNAQVWAQSEVNSQAAVEIGDTVTVRRGALGSYLLVTKAGIGTRVRRVK